MEILIVVVFLLNGELEYRKYEYLNNAKTVEQYIVNCDQFATELREKISYHTWNYKNKGPSSQGWYLKDDSGQIIATIC